MFTRQVAWLRKLRGSNVALIRLAWVHLRAVARFRVAGACAGPTSCPGTDETTTDPETLTQL